MENESTAVSINDTGDQASPAGVNENTNQATMEVHHHPDLEHKKKHWQEYVLEFLMIFIAVTLGFLAENLREHISEKHIEKEYIASFVADIGSDAKKISQIIPEETIAIAGIDTLYTLLTQPSRAGSDINKMYYLFRKYTMKFDPMAFNQGTYTQLRNAGGLRLIKNKAAADSIVSYNTTIDDINATISYTTHDFMLPSLYLGNKIFNLKYLANYSPETIEQVLSPAVKTSLTTTDVAMLTEYANLIYQLKGIRTTYLNQLIFQRGKSERISKFLQAEYRISE